MENEFLIGEAVENEFLVLHWADGGTRLLEPWMSGIVAYNEARAF